jgi:hypothetical protein
MTALTTQEEMLGLLAATVIAKAGGVVTFDEYDNLMARERYFAPIMWCQGWGQPQLLKSNQDKLCVFAACRMGIVRQIDDCRYEVTQKGLDMLPRNPPATPKIEPLRSYRGGDKWLP